MKLLPTAIEGMKIIEPLVLGDERGYFLESYTARDLDAALGHRVRFVQDNHSHSTQGVLRGLHYQLPPHAQGKLVRVVQGAVFDVSVDLRRSSTSFGRWVGVHLTAENHRIVWLPPGLAHGFLVVSASADFIYKATAYYAAESERCLRWNDPNIGIDWPTTGQPPLLTHRDASAPWLADSTTFD